MNERECDKRREIENALDEQASEREQDAFYNRRDDYLVDRAGEELEAEYGARYDYVLEAYAGTRIDGELECMVEFYHALIEENKGQSLAFEPWDDRADYRATCERFGHDYHSSELYTKMLAVGFNGKPYSASSKSSACELLSRAAISRFRLSYIPPPLARPGDLPPPTPLPWFLPLPSSS